MKKITEKGMTHKIIITILFVILFNFIFSNVSQVKATDDKKDGTDYGFGILFEPIKDLLLGVSDAVIWGIQYIILGQEQTFLDFAETKTQYSGGLGATVPVAVQTIKLPKFNISPEEMFSNSVPLLDVNFFNPAEPKAMNDEYDEQETSPVTTAISEVKYKMNMNKAIKQWFKDNGYEYNKKNLTGPSKNEKGNYSAEYYYKNEQKSYKMEFEITETKDGTWGLKRETTIKGFLTICDITQVPSDIVDSSSMELQPIVSKWYYALRNFSIVMLLSILVYIAIRIIISSSMEDRAKYKTRLYDWLVAMCLIFFMHYIMSFAVTLTEEIIDVVNSANLKYECNVKFNGDDDVYYTLDGKNVDYDSIKLETNLMGKVRLDMQIMPEEYTDAQVLLHSFGYTVMYMGLIMYTVLFLFRYLKRLLILTFLTMIAPLMAMTYPLDKMHDGKAQGFMTWLKEYVYNLLIQPVHLILYTVLIGTAIDLLDDNILYSLVAFGFILQAEKLMMKFFGFNKASTVSSTSAALGGALAVKGISMLSQKLGGNNKKPNKEQKENDNKIKQANRKPDKDINQLMGSVFGTTGTGLGGGSSPQNPPTTNENQDAEGDGGNQPPTYNGQDNGQGNGQDNSQNNGQDNSQNNGQNGNQIFDSSNTQPNNNNENNNQSEQANNNPQDNNNSQQDDNSQEQQEREALEELNRLANRDNENQNARPRNNKRTLTKSQRVVKGAKYIGPRLIKALAKGTLKAGLMGTGATIGLTAGLVSDDFSNVFKYGAVGAGAGLIAGEGLAKKAFSLKDKVSDEYNKFYEATHSKEELNSKLEEQALKSAKRIEKYKEKFKITKVEAEKMLQEEVRKYREYGVTDDDIIIKAMKAKEFGDATTPEQRTSNERIILAKMAQQVGGKEENYKRLKEGLADRGLSNADVSKYLGAIRTFNHWV